MFGPSSWSCSPEPLRVYEKHPCCVTHLVWTLWCLLNGRLHAVLSGSVDLPSLRVVCGLHPHACAWSKVLFSATWIMNVHRDDNGEGDALFEQVVYRCRWTHRRSELRCSHRTGRTSDFWIFHPAQPERFLYIYMTIQKCNCFLCISKLSCDNMRIIQGFECILLHIMHV